MHCKIIFAILFLAGWSTPGFAMSINVFDDGAVQYATLQGVIDPDTPSKAKTQLEAAVQKKPIAVFIQSDGGAYVAIKPMADMLLDLAKKHYAKYQKPLMVNFQMVCASGCSILSSLLTKNRDPKTLEIRVANATVFGFHGSVIRDAGKTDKKATLEAKDGLETQIVQTYLDAGVSSDFIKTNANMFKVHFKQTLFPAKQMCEQKTMVIPIDSCVENQLEVYKWIIKWTASADQQKILIPTTPVKPPPPPTATPPTPGGTADPVASTPPVVE
jgi:hypothetical protein